MSNIRVDKLYIDKNNIFYDKILEYCREATIMYNQCLYQQRQRIIHYSQVRQAYAESNNLDVKDTKVKTYMMSLLKSKQEGIYSYPELYKILKDDTQEFYKHYSSLHSHVSQQIMKQVCSLFQGYFTKIKNGTKVGLPRYKDNNLPTTITLTTACFKQVKHGYLQIKDARLKVDNKNLILKTRSHLREDFESYQQIKFKCLKDKIVVYILYRVSILPKRKDNDNYMSIDLGLCNYCTITTNLGLRPIIIGSKSLIGKIRSCNYKLSKLQSANAMYCNKKNKRPKDTKQMRSIRRNLRNYQDNFEHLVSNYIIAYAINNNINTIVIGYNKNWKCKSKMRKKVNRVFEMVSYSSLLEKLEYKCESLGLKLVTVNESYTSGTSFLDLEYPNKTNYNKSRRIYRGMFKSNKGILINSDVNGSYQILKKYRKDIYENNIQGLKINPIGIKILRV